MKSHLVGGGLASLAAAAYLIRDAGVRGQDITIYEARTSLGGSLAAAGNTEAGYIYPGSRVLESEYRCAMDLFAMVPSRSDPGKTIKQEIDDFNSLYSWSNRTRLIGESSRIENSSRMGLTLRHKYQLVRLLFTPESLLDDKKINEFFTPDFYETNFWSMWSSIMAFVPEHSAVEMRRYMLRFMHLLPDLPEMKLILRTKYNQYQAIIEPLSAWLAQQGVNFATGVFVNAVDFDPIPSRISATGLHFTKSGVRRTLKIDDHDVIMVTNGSQLTGMSIGSMNTPPRPYVDEPQNSWTLWKSLAQHRKVFGRPETFTEHVGQSRWVSFTVTCNDSMFPRLLEAFSGRQAGRGGLMTFKGSNWLITIVSFHQPNFVGQPASSFVWWGYGIYPERVGNFVTKRMLDCSGGEILREVLMHLGFSESIDSIIESSVCIPCLLPFVSSVCLARKKSDRPKIVPEGSTNFAFIGQFCEQPEDVIFTMEYSVRSAWSAVHELLQTQCKPPPVYRGYLSGRVMSRVLKALFA